VARIFGECWFALTIIIHVDQLLIEYIHSKHEDKILHLKGTTCRSIKTLLILKHGTEKGTFINKLGFFYVNLLDAFTNIEIGYTIICGVLYKI
jgi:hypothetical protein